MPFRNVPVLGQASPHRDTWGRAVAEETHGPPRAEPSRTLRRARRGETASARGLLRTPAPPTGHEGPCELRRLLHGVRPDLCPRPSLPNARALPRASRLSGGVRSPRPLAFTPTPPSPRCGPVSVLVVTCRSLGRLVHGPQERVRDISVHTSLLTLLENRTRREETVKQYQGKTPRASAAKG